MITPYRAELILLIKQEETLLGLLKFCGGIHFEKATIAEQIRRLLWKKSIL